MHNTPGNLSSPDGHASAFDRVAIIGTGLIGGSLGLALRARGLAREVVAVARSEESLRLAVERGAADQATGDIATAVTGADLVVLAAPVSQIIEHLQAIAGVIRPDCVITDVGSVKGPIVTAAEQALPHPARFVGGHPLAGSEQRGMAAARDNLFEGAPWLLTPTPVTDRKAVNDLERLATAVGAAPLVLSPREHDALLARTSHLPHLTAAALVNVVAQYAQRHRDTLQVIGTGFRDTTRIAAGDAHLWADIALANAEPLLACLQDMSLELDALAKALRDGNRELLQSLLARAQHTRESL